MLRKLFIAGVLSFTFLNASHVTLRIGEIDGFYDKRISKEELTKIVEEIENTFESTLGFDVFDLEKDRGRPINLVHLPSSKASIKADELERAMNREKEKIEKMQGYFLSKEDYIMQTQQKLKSEAEKLNQRVMELNSYIKRLNEKQVVDMSDYEKGQKYIAKERRKIISAQDRFNQKKLRLNDLLSAYKQKLSLYNSHVNEFYRLQRKLELVSRASKIVRGAAIGYKQVVFKTFSENGQRVQKLVEDNYMEKIEIYGFRSFGELKAILAHEIAHMTGVEHVNVRGALMNAVLQRNQVGNLKLTPEDIRAFKEVF